MKTINLIFCLFVVLQLSLVVYSKHYQGLGWTLKSTQNQFNDETIIFRIYLKQNNLNVLKEKVIDISSPSSLNYAKYLTPDEILDIIAPDSDSSNFIKNWVQSYDPIEIVDYVDSLQVKMTKSKVEKLFNIKMNLYEHTKGNKIFRSANDVKLSKEISKHIDLITGISNFPVVSNKKASRVLNQGEVNFPLDSSSSGSESSSADPIGFTIQRILGFGETGSISFTPTCSPKCPSDLTKVQISATVTASNSALPESVSTPAATALCSTSQGLTLCSATIATIPYIPTYITVTEISDPSASPVTYGYTFISTPVITPQSIKDYYGVPEGYVITTNVSQSVVEFEQQYMSTDDLETFFQNMGLSWDYNLTFVGYNDVTNPGIEASLDIEYIMGIAPGATTVFWSIYANSSVEIDDILSWATAIFTTPNPPLVSSLSYGMTEDNVDKFQGVGYLARSDVEFQKLALLGLTVIIASGDSGAGDLGPAPMSMNNCNTLHADWPSQSPYVQSVGSIFFTPLDQPVCYLPLSNGGISCIDQPMGEVGVSIDYGQQWSSGGCFSNFTPTAWYQEDFVKEYTTTYSELLPPSNLFNVSGRAYPDFSTVGHNLWIINGGQWMSVDGTSASAPIFGGLVTILNDVRAKLNLPPLGFLNPLFYQIKRDYPEAFYDVVVGNNRCGIYNQPGAPTCCSSGFSATPGFDTVSGIGRPNMEVLMRVIQFY